jgi:hypothetical protein
MMKMRSLDPTSPPQVIEEDPDQEVPDRNGE